MPVYERFMGRNLEDGLRFMAPAPDDGHSRPEDQGDAVHELLEAGESNEVEFKSSLRVDIAKGCVSKDVEHATVKTLAAFLNSHGGFLLIGVSDDRQIMGLQPDYDSFATIDKRDRWRQHFDNLVSDKIGSRFWNNISLEIETFSGANIAVIEVTSSAEPVFVDHPRHGGMKAFFVRASAGSRLLPIEEAVPYALQRWS